MNEVTSAVIATSLVLISVFVPVSFFPGTTGILYKQFSLTIAFAIAISAFNALTLSPALAAILLRPEQHHRGLLKWIDNGIKWVVRMYAIQVTFFVNRMKTVMVLLFVAGLAAAAYMYQHVPTAFVPSEDQGYFLCIVQTPPGASLGVHGGRGGQGFGGDPAEQGCVRDVCGDGVLTVRWVESELGVDLRSVEAD